MQELTIKDILLKSSEYLKNKGIYSSRYDTELLLSHFLCIPRMNLYLDFEKIVSEEIANNIRQAVIDRGKRKPLQYIIGHVMFLDCKIEVNEDVLVPRPETELMVDIVVKFPSPTPPINVGGNSPHIYGGGRGGNILDLCTGSGAIAIALKKKLPDYTVYASDICEKALKIARQNALKNNVEVIFFQSDLFDTPPPPPPTPQATWGGQKFNIIISNPPYVSEEDYQNLEPELFFEPKTALVSPQKGLYFIENIITQAKDYLAQDGYLYLELGLGQAEQAKNLANENQYTEIEILQDLNNKNRIIRMKYNG